MNINDSIPGLNIFSTNLSIKSTKIAAFDLDYTLIRPKSGNKFPKDHNDWILMDGVAEKLNALKEDGYKIVICTNQGSSSYNKDLFAEKIANISKALNLDLSVYAAIEHGIYRKPCTGIWNTIIKDNGDIPINLEECCYFGDAAGRPGDFSDTDLTFALNIGIKFYTSIDMTPEKLNIPEHPLTKCAYIHENTYKYVNIKPEKELVILIGPPASGKSTFCNRFPTCTVINQDTLVTKEKIIAALKKALGTNKSIIIDRKNEYSEDRSLFIKMAKEHNYSITCVFFNVPRSIAEHLNAYRNITTNKYISSVVYNKYYSKEKGLQQPDLNEGFDSIIELPFIIDPNMIIDKSLFDSYLV